MNDFICTGSNGLPKVTAYWEPGLVEFSGDANPDNVFELFKPLNQWIHKYHDQKNDLLKIYFRITYMNTSFSLAVLDMIRQLNVSVNRGFEIQVKWFYQMDDEDMFEAGDDFKDVAKFSFQLIPF